MALPKRKTLRLAGYDYASSGAYFITICVKDQKPLLGHIVGAADPSGPRTDLTVLGKVTEKYLQGIQGLDQYVIMPNHLHMVIFVEQTADSSETVLSQRIKAFKHLVTKEAGQSIFQRSYYDHVIRNQADYLRVAAYIQTNPAKWAEDRYYGK